MNTSESILKAIGESYFILQSNRRLENAIPPILTLLGNATKVDRVYIFKNYKKKTKGFHFSQKFEWVAKGVLPQINFPELQDVPWSTYPKIRDDLSQNIVINEVLSETTYGGDFYAVMATQGILSFLFIPIMAGQKFWGFMGFDNCSQKIVYAEEQVTALHALTATLGFTLLASKQNKHLLRAKKNYSCLLNKVHEVIFKLDNNHRWSFLNIQWEKITEYSIKSTLGSPFRSAFKEPYQEKIISLIEDLAKGIINEVSFDAELILLGGKYSWVKVKANSQFSGKNKFLGITGFIIDINREKQVLLELRESVEQTNAVIHTVKDTLYSFSGNLKKVLFVSDNLGILEKYETNKFELENSWLDIISSEENHSIEKKIKHLNEKDFYDGVYKVKNNQGKELWIQDKAWAVKDEFGTLVKIHGRYTDITELKNNELKLRLSEESLEKLNDLIQAVNETQINFNVEDDLQSLLKTLLTKILEITGSKFGFIGEILTDENNSQYLKTHTVANISWPDEAEDFFDENLNTGIAFKDLNTLFEKSILNGELVISNNPNSKTRATGTLEGNPALAKYMGIPVFKGKELLGLMGFANKDADYTEKDLSLLQPLISGYANLIKSIRIQKQKKEAERLRKIADDKYRLLSENTGDVIALHSLDLKFEYISPSIQKVLGFLPEECIGKTPTELFGVKELEKSVLLERETTSSVMKHHHKTTGKLVMLETLITPLKNDLGEIYSFMGTSRDVTERESALNELKDSFDREKQLHKLKSKFISMTSHEFRTPLATIMSSTEILEILLNDINDNLLKEKTKIHINRLYNQVKRLTGFIEDLLILEKTNQNKIIVGVEEISLNTFIKKLVTENFPENISKISLKLPKEELLIRIDTSLLTHIIINLIDNSIKYSKNIKKYPEVSLDYVENKYIITIKDYGIGIPISDQPFIYDSYFRAKNTKKTKGTGLGLNIVKEIIKKLEGQIHFKSIENEGSEFVVILKNAN